MAIIDGSSKRLKQCNFKLNLLLEVTQAINQNLSIKHLLDKYQDILVNNLNIGQILIFKYNGTLWEEILNYGYTRGPVIHPVSVEKDLLVFTDISFVTASPNPALKWFDIVIPVFNNNIPIAYVLIGDIVEDLEGISPTIKHLHFIQTLSNIIITAAENIRLFNESLSQAALKRELELASKMQNMLIPDEQSLPKNEHVFCTAYYQPHFEIGGDYYDFIQLDDHLLGFCIADVSGKGISAALLMSNFQANLRALLTSTISLPDLAGILNHRVVKNVQGDRYITLFLGRYNYKTHVLEYFNAGHNPPIFYEKKQSRLTFLNQGCTAMGMLEEIPIVKLGSLTIDGPAKLLCFTDGIVEVIGKKGMETGTRLLEDALSNSNHISVNIQDIIRFSLSGEKAKSIIDDITLLGIEFPG